LDEIAELKDFEGYIISQQDFEEMWNMAKECELGY